MVAPGGRAADIAEADAAAGAQAVAGRGELADRLAVDAERLAAPGLPPTTRARPGGESSGHGSRVSAQAAQARRNAITPATMTPVPRARWKRKRSFSISTPISAANSTDVSRNAATDAIGARVMAHSAMA